ncbi:MAG TPA: serine/threonine-protein kinase, partial [Ktedonobacteraceae bacterium]
GRYLVIDTLGKGGFSAVYLVQDRQREDRFFALKEGIAFDREAREHFAMECALLKRLVHPALPQVHEVFDDEEHNRMYMLMDYVEGPNLETLLSIQPEKRFSLPVTTAVLAPIADALEYLHQQDPPVIHRDIKPSNIIVPVVGGKTILVDFGIAKEFDSQGTTNATRHATPGYGAPEHYAGGTSALSDIYGLGATIYTLLTGEVPPDAVERLMRLGNSKPDPLKPVSELVPSIPLHISRTIQRAMAVNMTQRYATVKEFWQTFLEEPGQKPISEALGSLVGSPSTPEVSPERGKASTTPEVFARVGATTTSPQHVQAGRRSRKRLLLPTLLALLLIAVIGAGLLGVNILTSIQKHPANTPTGRTGPVTLPTLTPISSATVAATVIPSNSTHLFPTYNGTLEELSKNVPSQMTLTHMQQNNGIISGTFTSTLLRGDYTGYLDSSKHISFTVANQASGAQLYFMGKVQSAGNIEGSFCSVDQNNQCISGQAFGVWNVVPVR